MKNNLQFFEKSGISQNSTLSQFSVGGKKTLQGNFLKNTFNYKVGDFKVKINRAPERKLTLDEIELEKNYQIYSSLKMIQKQPSSLISRKSSLTNLHDKPKQMTKIARYRNEFSVRRVEESKRLEEKLFTLKKTNLIQQNKKSLQNDLTSLGRISTASYQTFKRQINLYNKYYSNYLSEELPLDNFREPTRKIDLNINQIKTEDLNFLPGKVEGEQKYTYKKSLQFLIPNDIFDTIELNKKRRELKLYNHSVFQFDKTIETLEEYASGIKSRKNNEMDREFIRLIRKGDEYQVGQQLVINPDLINAQDDQNQNALSWALKRNNPIIIKMLIAKRANQGQQELLNLKEKDIQSQQKEI